MASEQQYIALLEQMVEQQKITIETLQKQMETLQKQNEALNSNAEMLKDMVDQLNEQIISLKHYRFGSSSEKTEYLMGEEQISFFNEMEVEENPAEPDPLKTNKKKAKKPKTRRPEILKDLPTVEKVCVLPDDMLICPGCGSTVKKIAEEFVRDEVRVIPAHLEHIRYVRAVYECPECKHTDKPVFLKGYVPHSLLNHSLVSPSMVSTIMYDKYVNAMPLYRQEKEFERLGLSLSRATMANWCIRCSEYYLEPLFELLRRNLLTRDIIQSDETSVQVLKEDGKPADSKSYMWEFMSGQDGRPPVVLFRYFSSRKGDNPAEFLDGFKGYLQTDGYSGYNAVQNVIHVGCWAHMRRKFTDAVRVHKGKEGQEAKLSVAEKGVDYCNQLFELERDWEDLTPQERMEKRKEKATPVIAEFEAWVDSLTVLPKSKLAKAVTYAKNQRKYLKTYLLDGRIMISNNNAENAVRPFTVGRKNWLFCDSTKGANASATIYSIIETAKANGLDPKKYLEYIFTMMPGFDTPYSPNELLTLMPWTKRVQAICAPGPEEDITKRIDTLEQSST